MSDPLKVWTLLWVARMVALSREARLSVPERDEVALK
jgi:hypothetical protein